MAGLIKQGNLYWARVRMPKGSPVTERKIGLNTGNEKEARLRRRQVELREADIKAGLDYVFPWEKRIMPRRRPATGLEKAKKGYLKALKVDEKRIGTIDIYTRALNHFEKVLGKRVPVHEITVKHIDQYKEAARKSLGPVTVNMMLRAIKTFLRWLHDRDQIAKVPKIKQIPVPTKDPKYVSNDDFKKILKKASPEMQEIFHFYRDTGCRLSEPFLGKIDGAFLVISPEESKSRSTRVISLTEKQIEVLQIMRAQTHLPTADKKGLRAIRKTHDVKHYSRAFTAACTAAKVTGKSLHSLRHTFALREYLRTRDIYHVQKALGHASVTTTEIYSRFNSQKLEQDFPDLMKPKNWTVSKAV